MVKDSKGSNIKIKCQKKVKNKKVEIRRKKPEKFEEKSNIQKILDWISQNRLITGAIAVIFPIIIIALFFDLPVYFYLQTDPSGPLCIKGYCSEDNCQKLNSSIICECTINLRNRDPKRDLQNIRVYVSEEDSICFLNLTRSPIRYINKRPMLFGETLIKGGTTFPYKTQVMLPVLDLCNEIQQECGPEVFKCTKDITIYARYEYVLSEKESQGVLDTYTVLYTYQGLTKPIEATIKWWEFCRKDDTLCEIKVEILKFLDEDVIPVIHKMVLPFFPWAFCD